jgi:hypothetical protein
VNHFVATSYSRFWPVTTCCCAMSTSSQMERSRHGEWLTWPTEVALTTPKSNIGWFSFTSSVPALRLHYPVAAKFANVGLG